MFTRLMSYRVEFVVRQYSLWQLESAAARRQLGEHETGEHSLYLSLSLHLSLYLSLHLSLYLSLYLSLRVRQRGGN